MSEETHYTQGLKVAMRQANALERIASAVETLVMDKLTTPAKVEVEVHDDVNGAARFCETTDEAAS